MMGDFDWTTVQRRRGRRRAPQFQQDGDWDRSGWMARAPPAFSYRRQVYFSNPSRPAPPPRTSRYYGPNSRSFASVVRQGNQGHNPKKGTWPSAESEQVRREPADPQFGRVVRKMHALIKMVHHLQNVAPKEGKQQPRMIARMVQTLTTMIRPASPIERTLDLIKGNAQNWGYNTLLILQDHYEAGLETLMEDLSSILPPDWKPHFQVAMRWAKRNIPHVSQEVLDHVEALLTAKTVGNIQHQSDSVAQSGGAKHRTATVATMTDIGDLPVEQVPPPDPQFVLDPLLTEDSPREQRQERYRRRRGVVLTEDLLLEMVPEKEDTPPEPDFLEERSERSWNQDLEDLFGSAQSRHASSPELLSPMRVSFTSMSDASGAREQTVQAQVLRDFLEEDSSEAVVQESSLEESNEQTSTPVLAGQSVTRHKNSDRKMIDWDLWVTKKWLIVGDSNLSKIPTFDVPDLQIESYPGANFRHAEALMKKATSTVTVLKVILSFGLNHRNQKARETSVKQLQGAVRAAKRRFPYAEIWVPQINFSSALPPGEKQTLKTLNSHIERNMPTLQALPTSDFRTEKDHVHWTKKTAMAMLRHWATLLNLAAL